jgi:alanine-synthesizing transaminase
MDRFSSRSRFTAAPNRITSALAAFHRSGRALCDLTESNPTRVDGLSPSAAELDRVLADPRVARYAPEPFGLRAARETLCDDLHARGFTLDVSSILLTASTSEAYCYLLKLLCDPGDSVLVPAPSYPLFDVLAQLEQVRLIPYRLAYDGEWHVDVPALRAACEPRTRAIVTVHPNNPTGSFLKRSELRELASLDLPILSDEVFADYALRADATRAESALEVADRTLVFRLGGLSKAAALPQLKLAWTAFAGPKPLVDEARARLENIADAYLSPGTQVQLALAKLLSLSGEVRARIVRRVRQNLEQLTRALADSAASVLAVEGGWYAIVRLPSTLDDEEWALTLLERDGVLVQPGYYYDLVAGTYVVISLIGDPAVTAEGCIRLAARVDALSQ